MKKIPLALAISAALFLAACGQSEAPTAATPAASPAAPAPAAAPAEPAAAPVAAAPAAAPVADGAAGKSIYNKTCALCHASGVAGAPIPGNKDDWAARIAQGKETMYKHSIEGFTGEKGLMPARGGNPKLTDEEMKAAVDFMADQSI